MHKVTLCVKALLWVLGYRNKKTTQVLSRMELIFHWGQADNKQVPNMKNYT